MDAVVKEALAELSKFGLADLLRKDDSRCKFLVGPEKEVVLGCPSVLSACCPALAKLILSEGDKPMRLLTSLVKVDGFKNIMQFLHTGTLDMSLLKSVKDYVDFAKVNHFIQVPPLLQLSLRLLQPKVNPSNVWSILIRLVHKPHLATVCDEVLQTQTRECLSSLAISVFSRKTIIYFLKFDQMNINSETEILTAFAQFNQGAKKQVIRSTAPRGLRFMTLSDENLSRDLPLLEKILSPDKLKAVLLAIKSRDPTKLPPDFKTSVRKLTNATPPKKSETSKGKEPLVDQTHTGSIQAEKKPISAAVSQSSTSESRKRKNSSGKIEEDVKFGLNNLETCRKPLDEQLSMDDKQRLPRSRMKYMRYLVSSVGTDHLDLSELKSIDDYVEFLVASHELKMPKAMKMSLDLIKKQITPKDVWFVLRKIGHIVELRCLCNKIFSEQTMECLQFLDEDTNRHAASFFLSLDEMNIDSEIQLLKAFIKVKIVHEGKHYCLMRTVANNLRFMTLSLPELGSVKTLLQKFLTDKEYKAVHSAIESGDSSKLPARFSKSSKHRKPSSSVQPSKLDSAPPATEDDFCHTTPNKIKISEEINVDKIELNLERVDEKHHLVKTKKLKRQMCIEDVKQEEPELKLAAKRRRNKLSEDLLADLDQKDEEMAKKNTQRKTRGHPKEETIEQAPAAKSDFNIGDKLKHEQFEENMDDKNSVPKIEIKKEEHVNQLWEFIETNGAIQVKRKYPKSSEEWSQEKLCKKSTLEIKNEPIENPSTKESEPQKHTIKLTSLVHFELLQDCAQQARNVHHVRSEAEKVIINVKVLKDLQLLGVELSARTEDTKLLNKYKKSSSSEIYEEALEVSVFSSELGLVFKSSVQGQRAYNSRLVINASNMPVIPQGSKLRVKVTAFKGAAYRTVSNVAFKGADAVLGKASVQHKVLAYGDWMPVNRNDFCPITRLFLKVQN